MEKKILALQHVNVLFSQPPLTISIDRCVVDLYGEKLFGIFFQTQFHQVEMESSLNLDTAIFCLSDTSIFQRLTSSFHEILAYMTVLGNKISMW